jgi:hypothetical protein
LTAIDPAGRIGALRAGRSGTAEPGSSAPFALLAFALAAQLLLQNRRVFEFRYEPELVHWAWSLCIVASLLRPRSVSLFATTWAGVVWYCASRMPTPSNHVLWMGGMGVLFSCVVVWRAIADRTLEGLDRERLFRVLAPPLRLSLLAVYFWAFFHKLNAGFFDASESCAVGLAGRAALVASGGSWSPELPAAAAPLAIGGTLLFEAAIPVLLVLRRTRMVALAIGVPFHAVLGLAGFFSFSTLVFALYTTFLPESAAVRLTGRWRTWRARHPWGRLVIPVLGVVGALIVFTPRYGPIHRFSVDLWLLAVLAVWAWLLWDQRSWLRPLRWPAGFLRPRPALLVLLPAAVLVNGAAPYLGFKTTPVFSMFSNLRTEGELHNHWIVPKRLQVVDWQDDLVVIEQGNHPWLAARARPDVQVVYHELRAAIDRIRAAGRHVSLTYRRQGESIQVDTVRDPNERPPPLPAWRRKLIAFRDVRPHGCAW